MHISACMSHTVADICVKVWNDFFRETNTPMYQTPPCDFIGTAYTLKLSICLQWTEDPSKKVTERWETVKICRVIGMYFPECYVDKQNFKALNLIQARHFRGNVVSVFVLCKSCFSPVCLVIFLILPILCLSVLPHT